MPAPSWPPACGTVVTPTAWRLWLQHGSAQISFAHHDYDGGGSTGLHPAGFFMLSVSQLCGPALPPKHGPASRAPPRAHHSCSSRLGDFVCTCEPKLILALFPIKAKWFAIILIVLKGGSVGEVSHGDRPLTQLQFSRGRIQHP